MIGIDILYLPRIRGILGRSTSYGQEFAHRVLHPNERKRMPDREHLLINYLGTWYEVLMCVANISVAAKEAAFKAFQPEKRLTWHQLEVWKHITGFPPPKSS